MTMKLKNDESGREDGAREEKDTEQVIKRRESGRHGWLKRDWRQARQ